jgi:uncharacterized protein with HEPN domain
MTAEKNFSYEILAIDKTGASDITTVQSLIRGLSYSELLWENPVINDACAVPFIEDKNLDIILKVQKVDTSKALSDYLIESAFLIKAKSKNFKTLEIFRKNILIHLRRKLGFTNIRILTDDISTSLSFQIYPLINQVENLLRRYLVKFFIQKVGLNWWEVTAPKLVIDKVKMRGNNEKVFSNLVDTDVTLIDFDDLGELIYKQTSGFNRPERIIEKVMNTNSPEELVNLKTELQGNYTKYFKSAFQDNQFEKKWKQLFEIRNKVAHNNLFTYEDFEISKQLCDDLSKVVEDAENKIDEFSFSVEEKEAIRNASIEILQEEETAKKDKDLESYGLKVLGKIDLPDEHRYENPFEIISEEDLLSELKNAERTLKKNNFKYVGLKSFVTKLLGNKGYSFGPTYSLINILNDKGMVEIYDYIDDDGFVVKAVKLR